MITYTNKEFDFLNPTFNITDIAVGLSREGRFSNQYPTQYGNREYTVAKHSIIGSYLIERPYKLAFLLHDAAEAYVRDLPTPLKKLCPDYTKIEKDIQAKIYDHFKIKTDDSMMARIKEIDNIMYEWERKFLFLPGSTFAQIATAEDRLNCSRYNRIGKTHRVFLRYFNQYLRYV